MKSKNKKGFTLIELLIVIGIISILASAVVISINPAEHFERARNAARLSHMNSAINSMYTYSIDHDGVLPACEDESVFDDEYDHIDIDAEDYNFEPLGDGTGELGVDEFENERPIFACQELQEEGYMVSFPQDPEADHYYRVSSDEDGNRIRITSSSPEAGEETRVTQ